MAQNYLTKIEKLNNSELIQLLKKNGYGDFRDILEINALNGAQFLALKEFEIARWKLPPNIRKKVWICLLKIKENPQHFFMKNQMKQNVITTAKQTGIGMRERQGTNITQQESVSSLRKKLELVLSGPPTLIKPESSNTLKPNVQLTPSTPPEEYLAMDKLPPPQSKDCDSHYDENGYLIPISKSSHNEEENSYEPVNSTNEVIGFRQPSPVGQKPPALLPSTKNKGGFLYQQQNQRSPQVLPRTSSDENGYLHEHAIKQATRKTRRDPSPALPPRLSPQPNLKTRSPPPSPVSSFGSEPEDEEQTYEPAPYEDKDGPLAQGATFSKTFLNVFKNPLGGGKNSRDTNPNERGWNTLQVKKPARNKSPTESVRSLDIENVKKINHFIKPKASDGHSTLTSRPLPPLPNQISTLSNQISTLPNQISNDDEPSEIYENINENNNTRRPPTPDQIYSNELPDEEHPPVPDTPTLPPRLPKVDHNEKVPLPRNNQSYEHFLQIEPNRKHLPVPPATIPQFKFDPEMFRRCDDQEETEIYQSYITNFKDEPYYRDTDRRGAKQLLQNLEDGAFLIRPSTSNKFVLTLSLMYNSVCFHLGIEQTNKKFRLNSQGEGMSPEFASIHEFIDYFTRDGEVTFLSGGNIVEVRLKKLLPPK